MNSEKIVKSLDGILFWITRLTLLNLLWFYYSIRGLIVAGVFPSTAAALGVAKKWIQGERDRRIGEVFKRLYKREFMAANKLGWLLTFIGAVLYVNYQLIVNAPGQLSFIVPFSFYTIVFFYSLVVLWSFPMLISYQAKTFQYVKNSVVVGLTKLHISAAVLVFLFTITYHSLGLPVLLLFFYISVSVLGWMWLTMKVFRQIPVKEEKEVYAS
ncbi:YesL family protein [Halobacillus sp. B23F22_1]|uniref:YesL family protein n=1 Tax=Halobacillus sp. B23F22_1 TaxID=3459514 RepID=UPI00373E5791